MSPSFKVVAVIGGKDHSSVAEDSFGLLPPANKPEVPVPEPDPLFLAVPRSFTSVQDVPSKDSVFATLPGDACPPIAKAKVDVPKPPSSLLVVFKSAFSDQDVPLYSSVLPILLGGPPPKANAAV